MKQFEIFFHGKFTVEAKDYGEALDKAAEELGHNPGEWDFELEEVGGK